jgi:polyether ionophore transport system permease protein
VTADRTGTWAVVRLVLRRDRILLPVWLLVLAGVAGSSASATVGIFPTAAARRAAAEAVNAAPALVALYGRIYDPDNLGGIAMLKMTGFGGVLVAILMALTVIRHTRADEEAGRTELIRAGVLGRQAPLLGALIVTLAASLLLGLLTALGLMAAGLEVRGAWAFGLSWACAGAAFAAVAAVAAQLTASARAARGIAMAVLAVSFVLRAVGDISSPAGPGWLSWLSPIGWSQQIRPFGGDRWWVALIPLAFVVVAVGVALAVLDRRDVGAGLVQPRPGPATAGRTLSTPLGLAWRLQRGAFLAWLVGFSLLALVLGNMASELGGLLDSPQARDLITRMGGVQGLTDAFISTELGVAGVIAAAYGVQAVLRLRVEESSQRADPVLAAAVTRNAWVASHLVVALATSGALMLAMGLCVGLAHGVHTGDLPGTTATMVGAALARVPAVWAVTGLAAALFGLLPRATVAAWVALVAFLVVGELGPLMRLPGWAMDTSPFAHVPSLPGGSMVWAPLVVLLAVAALLLAVGVAGFRRRDVG